MLSTLVRGQPTLCGAVTPSDATSFWHNSLYYWAGPSGDTSLFPPRDGSLGRSTGSCRLGTWVPVASPSQSAQKSGRPLTAFHTGTRHRPTKARLRVRRRQTGLGVQTLWADVPPRNIPSYTRYLRL